MAIFGETNTYLYLLVNIALSIILLPIVTLMLRLLFLSLLLLVNLLLCTLTDNFQLLQGLIGVLTEVLLQLHEEVKDVLKYMNELRGEIYNGVDLISGLELGTATSPALHPEGDDTLLHNLFEEVVVMLADDGIAIDVVIRFVNFDPSVHVLFRMIKLTNN
jgi:hypothetical protein